MCLDVTDGDDKKPVQVWTCYDDNLNQRWKVW